MKFEKKHIIIICTVIFAIAIVVYFVMKNYKKTNELEFEVIDENGKGMGLIVDEKTDNFPLKKGSFGNNVEKLQIKLNKKYAKNVTVPNVPKRIEEDSKFGSETENALMELTGKKTISITEFNLL